MKRLLLILSFALVLAACDNTVDPVLEDADVRYAVHGFLDMRTDRQILRIESLRPTILAEAGAMVGVDVVVAEEGTGVRHVFRDSSATASDGSPLTLFVASFRPQAGRTYRLEAGRPGELPLVATTRIPMAPTLQFGNVTGTLENLEQVLFLTGIEGVPEGVTMYYTVTPPAQDDRVTIPVRYGRLASGPVSDLNFSVSYTSDRFVVMNALRLNSDTPGVRLGRIEMSVDLPSPEWRLVQPGNIQRGHGQFASVGRYRYSWRLDRPSVEILGWIDEQAGE
ncbi:MAG: hypothetical protein O3C45_02735 [Bacteroidetes bacterium]|nr:hypothetical protein [Bacteroidota bacterium]MDA0873957.1 hypothetical protein [Bacteroidota bacterium]